MSTADPLAQLARDLPVLGVGASLSFGVEPDPVALAAAPGGPDFVEYAGAVDPGPVRAAVEALAALDVPVLYHPSCLNLCGPWPNPPAWVAAVDQHVRAVSSPWLAQDVSVCFVGDVPGYSIQLGYFIPPARTEDALTEAIDRVLEVRDAVGAPLLLEPAPATFRWGEMPMLQWLDQLCEATGCGMLLDAGHVVSHGLLERADPLQGVDLAKVFEVHVAGGILHRTQAGRCYQDAHELPIQPEVWRMFDRIVAGSPHLKAVCVECEGAAATSVIQVLDKVRQRVAIHSPSEALRAQVRNGRRPGRQAVAAAPPRAVRPERSKPGPTHYPGLVELLFDAEQRARLPAEANAVAHELQVPENWLRDVDLEGLELDAGGRAQYLMSALCRPFPLSAGILGADDDGPARLSAFLTSPAMFGSLAERTAAFGAHLQRLSELRRERDKKVSGAIAAVVNTERAINNNAAAVRGAVMDGDLGRSAELGPPPGPHARQQGRIRLPAFTIVAELPHSKAVLDAALEGLGPADCWRRIRRQDVDGARIRAVLRSAPEPVTLLARAHTVGRGPSIERGASGGAAPLIEVSQRTVELRGRRGAWLQSIQGERLADLPEAQRKLAESLMDAGVLTVA